MQINGHLGSEDAVAYPASQLSPSISATFSYGIVVLVCLALELLIQEDERISRQRLAHWLLRFAILKRDHSSAS